MSTTRSKDDYYQTLNVGRNASAEEIRKSYRRLARKYHPDLNPGDRASEDRFKKIQEAHNVLSDPGKRAMYDQVGFYSESGFPRPGPGSPGGPGMGFSGFDFSDFFTRPGARPTAGAPAGGAPGAGGPGGGFRDLFSQFFGSGGRADAPAEAGSDLEYAVTIDFWKAIRGTQEKLEIARHEVCGVCGGSGASGGGVAGCPECNGSGSVMQMAGAMRFSLTCPRCSGSGKLRNVCAACHGEGRQARRETVEVRIPPGAQNGSRLRVAGKGSAGSMGMPPGDLYITTRVAPHPLFHRDGDDIHLKVPVSVTEAGLGTKIEVPTVEGKALLKIPPGTQNGQKFRLREKGVLNARKARRGDQIIEVSLVAPNVADERTRELLRELAQRDSADPRADLWSKV
ncbi:MAG: molecular chaperone DnaJ [Bryobacteraceae bacterium]